MMTYDDNLEALAAYRMGPEEVDLMARIGMPAGDLARFRALDRETRHLVLRLLDQPTDADHNELDRHPDGTAIAQWLLTLPAYRDAPDGEPDEDEDWE